MLRAMGFQEPESLHILTQGFCLMLRMSTPTTLVADNHHRFGVNPHVRKHELEVEY